MGSPGWVVVVLLLSGCMATGERPRTDALPAEPMSAGLTALSTGAWPEAIDGLDDAARRYPVLEDYALYFRARAFARAGRLADALGSAQQLRDRHPDSIWAGPSLLLTGETLRASGQSESARQWLGAARGALPRGDSRWGRASIGLAEEIVASSPSTAGWAPALDLTREVRRARPRGLVARRARRLSDQIRTARPAGTPDDHVDEAEIRLREGDHAGAREEAMAGLAMDPAPALVGRALWVRAQAEHALRLPGAEGTCLTLARELPADPLAPRALQSAASWRWNGDDDAGALALYRDLAHRFPTSPQASEALYAIGRIYQEEGARESARYGDAALAYGRLADTYPQAPLAAEARWRAGWVRWLAGDFARAEQAFASLAARAGGTVGDAAEYWQARAVARLGRDEDARGRLVRLVENRPGSYYAGLAEERLGRDALSVGAPDASPPPPFPAELTGRHAERAVLLQRLGLARFARREVDALYADGALPSLALVAYRAVGAPGAAMRIARSQQPEGADPRPEVYPLGYWDTVRPAATAHGLDPFLVVALIRQESAFEPDAVSSANAHGLMQLLPSTAREVSLTAGTAPPSTRALHDPAVNVPLGVALLARLRERYAGATPKALAAYNAGEEAVAKWERRYAGREPDEFVELISYRETRDYVKLVLRNARVYRQLYGRPPSASASSLGSPPNAPFDMTTSTSPACAVDIR